MKPIGSTRTTIKSNHALIAPDGHVRSSLPGWTGTQAIILISPQMRNAPQFSQYIAEMQPDAKAGAPLSGIQRFVFLLEGSVILTLSEHLHNLDEGKFAYLPAGIEHRITAVEQSRLLIFEKPYSRTALTSHSPQSVVGDAWQGSGEAFMGDDDARLRILLPTDLEYDMAVNLFTFQSGTALPFVETHIMEHGLYLLEGQGIYRLDDCWYPVQAGDVIWMGAYCPQWFCAFGKSQSTYIYYKDMNRDPFAG